jgi:hypothetical protein
MTIRMKLCLTTAAVLVAGAAGALAIERATSSSGLPVTVTPGAQPARDPELVARTVLDRLGPGATIEKMTAIPSNADISAYEPNGSKLVPGVEPLGPVWIVRARGAFVGRRVPPGTPEVHHKSGYYVVEDASGEILEVGMP